HQLSNGAVAAVQRVCNRLQLVQGRNGLVKERGIIDKLPDGSLAAVQRIDKVVHLGENRVQLLNGALAGLDHVRQVRAFRRLQLAAVLDWRSGGELAVDVHNCIAQHAYGVEAGFRVALQQWLKFVADLHHDFYRSKLTLRRDAHRLDVAYGHSVQVHRRAHLQTGGVLKIRA